MTHPGWEAALPLIICYNFKRSRYKTISKFISDRVLGGLETAQGKSTGQRDACL